jgi:hypothetical protein
MMPVRTVLHIGLLAALLGLSACGSSPMASSSVVSLSGQLSGASEVPANASAGSGTVSAKFDKATNVLSWNVTYGGLSGPAKAAHFHGPATAGVNAGVVVPLTGSLDSPINGTATLTPAQAADLLAGKWYLNVHTAAIPGGEIRAQVVAQP